MVAGELVLLIMVQLAMLDLENEGNMYVVSSLREGGKGLCLKLLDLPVYDGRTFAVVPEGTDLVRAKRLKTGGLMNMDSGRSWLAEHTQSLASKNQDGTLVFQDVWGAKPGDPCVRKKHSNMFFNQTSVYHFLNGRDITSDRVIATIREIASFLLVGAYVDRPLISNELLVNQFVEDDVIVNLSRNAQEIYVSAYDQESFVVWRRE